MPHFDFEMKDQAPLEVKQNFFGEELSVYKGNTEYESIEIVRLENGNIEKSYRKNGLEAFYEIYNAETESVTVSASNGRKNVGLYRVYNKNGDLKDVGYYDEKGNRDDKASLRLGIELKFLQFADSIKEAFDIKKRTPSQRADDQLKKLTT